MDEQQLQARVIRLANIPFTIPSEQVPVDLSLAELKRGQQDDAQCKQWREMLETWKAGGAQAQDKPAEVRRDLTEHDTKRGDLAVGRRFWDQMLPATYGLNS